MFGVLCSPLVSEVWRIVRCLRSSSSTVLKEASLTDNYNMWIGTEWADTFIVICSPLVSQVWRIVRCLRSNSSTVSKKASSTDIYNMWIGTEWANTVG
ncbi:hypothetical protein CDAR_115121 [Caerostris darwini]|uniref:Uncharacterized protein n=1 Tax=Caerostris darwini TaxID=1538125 RepID=A0AAV4U7A7_9ARAC|nr:hypothetical protein CDAR_115121 [Caerostris darwini]